MTHCLTHYLFPNEGGMFSLDWTYSMPSKMTGLRGSCLVIPCSFDFRTEKLSIVEVKWYLYSITQYPLVYSPHNENVIGKFLGKTRLYGLPSEKNCSLEIKQLEMHHNGDRLYPWMDPKSVETFHKENYYDKSIELQITGNATYFYSNTLSYQKVYDLDSSLLLAFDRTS